MKITDIKVFPVHEEKLKAFVSIVLDECFMVNDIKVIQGKEGFFISMPSRRKRNGKFKDVAHPLNNETRQSMEREILAAYEGTLDGAEEQPVKVKARPTGSREGRKPRRKPERVRPRAGAGDDGHVERELDGPSSPRPRREKPSDGPAESRGTAAAPQATESPVADTPDETASTDTEQEQTDKSPDEVAEHHLRDSFWGT